MNQAIRTTNAPEAIGPYSQAVLAGGFLYASGQIPLDPATGVIVEGGITEQTHRVLLNLQAVLNEAGMAFGDVVKTTIYLDSMDDFATVNAIYADYFKEGTLPARATVQVGKLPKNALVEIDCVAHK